jgi:isopentenyl diphosphate isomerase/L-lactate dehydrogenase-like FMN-dependent dehydrogenase
MQPINIADYETLAQEKLDPAIWNYYQGGSGDEVTLRANRTAFERYALRPRVLVDVSHCDLSTTVAGTPVTMPILVAPTAGHVLAHPDGELATVRAACAAGTVMIASTVASTSLEDIAAAATGPAWFQLYIRSMDRAKELVLRAEAAGYRAIVLTVDTPRLGNREKDMRYNARRRLFPAANFDEDDFTFSYTGDSLTWEVIGWLRSLTTLPIFLKGILTGEDALLAVEHGVEGIIVSNHGGRQLDESIATLEALPEVVEAVAGRCEVYMDGGIRRGTDILKALALGARAVLVGRPILWGLAVNGEEGARHVLEILRTELELAMALSGRTTLASIDQSVLKRVG